MNKLIIKNNYILQDGGLAPVIVQKLNEMIDMNETKPTRGFDLLGEAYQQSFDELREKLEQKGLSFMDSLILADFIQNFKLDHEIALSNVTEDTAERLLICIKKAEALSDACFGKHDLIILDELMRRTRLFHYEDIRELTRYCVRGHGIRGNRVRTIREACIFFECKLQEEAINCLTYVRED